MVFAAFVKVIHPQGQILSNTLLALPATGNKHPDKHPEKCPETYGQAS